ncbi:MAG: HAD-IIIA family hydrolase, partial [bacterium]
NQANIGRGTLSWTTLNDMHAGLRRALLPLGGCIDEIYVCPHRPEESCGCRKPRPGMLLRAASDHGLDLSRVWFIGDTASDMAAAEAAGAVGVRLRNDPDPPGLTNLSFTDLAAAVDALIASWQRGGVTG